MPAWEFLSAVLAERRRREMARMMPAPGYQPMSPYGGHHPAAPQPPPAPPYSWQHPVVPQHVAPQQVAPQQVAPQHVWARPAEEAPPERDGNPFTPPG